MPQDDLEQVEFALTSSSPLAVGHRLRGKGKDSYRV